MASRITHLPNTPPVTRARTSPRGILFAVLLGITLGTLISAGIVWLRPIPTGIADVKVIELHDDRAAGQSWVLELEADRTGYPFLIHLDDAGRASLLFPEGEITAISPGERRRLPDASGQRGWRSGGGEIWVTLTTTPNPALGRVFALAERAADEASNEDAARRAARKVLRSQLGPGVSVRLPDND